MTYPVVCSGHKNLNNIGNLFNFVVLDALNVNDSHCHISDLKYPDYWSNLGVLPFGLRRPSSSRCELIFSQTLVVGSPWTSSRELNRGNSGMITIISHTPCQWELLQKFAHSVLKWFYWYYWHSSAHFSSGGHANLNWAINVI